LTALFERRPMRTPSSLLVTSAPAVIESIEKICSSAGNLPLAVCPDLNAAVDRVGRENVVLILVHLPAAGDALGVQHLLRAVTRTRRHCATVVLADAHCDEEAATVLRAGAADYVQLPVEESKLGRLINTFTGQLDSCSAVSTPAVPHDAVNTEDDGLSRLLQQVERVAPQDTTILLMGDTGTGKTRLARMIHELSPRREQPFLVVDCGSLSPSLIESELFGHVRGAFTGADRERTGKLAAAAGGTLLLDEINSLPLPLQTKLLRAVDARVFEPVGSNREQPLRARLIAATNVALEDEMAAGRFRPDLYYRLNVVGFFLPPLRERRAAVAVLAKRFLEEFTSRNRPDLHGFDPAVLHALTAYDWPGNVRELRNVVERAVALCEGPEVTPEDLPEVMRSGQNVCPPGAAATEDSLPEPVRFARRESKLDEDSPADSAPCTLHETRREVEVRRILEALEQHDNNRLRAAKELGISRVGLYKKLHQYGLMNWGGKNDELLHSVEDSALSCNLGE
jgi:DNA-binding NtrC family response regulator